MLITLFVPIFIYPLVKAQSPSPAPAGPPPLSEVLIPSLNPPNDISNLLFPLSIIFLQTPIAVRYSLLNVIGRYEVSAACHPVALSFFGTKDFIPTDFCDKESVVIIFTYITYRLIASEFPAEAFALGQFLVRVGLTPFNPTTDETTLIGWANVRAARAIQFLSKDGWNSQGDLTKDDYLMRYDDTTGYRPVNPPSLDPSNLRRPLRWQPLRFSVDGHGFFAKQEHITPHIGLKVTPLAMSRTELEDKKVAGPYVSPNRRQTLSSRDKARVMNFIERLFNRTAGVTPTQITLVYFWENKFFGLGGFLVYYEALLGIPLEDMNRFVLGEFVALHDAVLLAWKEKVRHDLVRPKTLIRRLLKGKVVRAFKSFQEGAGIVKADEWEPLIQTQPHSEFPSASALLCTASLEHLQLQLEKFIGNSSIPAFDSTIQPFTLPFSPVDIPIRLRFRSLEVAAASCGQSRLLAGVHFAPSVPAGHKLGEGLGRIAFNHIEDLWAGRVPENCARCLRS